MNNNIHTEKIALFAGTFNPYTIGHHRIVQRALPLFNKIVIAIGCNPEKLSGTTVEERIEKIATIYKEEPRIEVTSYTGLTVDYAHSIGAQYLLRGVRSVKDFEYERELADINHKIGDIETVFLISEPEYASISSSMVRELQKYGKEISNYIP
ncbi:MAG: pantetheine-phosphate adenylyltransferase [Bacteroidaceae bacterium]|nr:pantetheine-phosphate adenylyltransferase [Bacteroidaceae bacterium]